MSYLPLVRGIIDLLKTMAWCIESNTLTFLSIHFNLHCTLLVVYVNITVVEGNI